MSDREYIQNKIDRIYLFYGDDPYSMPGWVRSELQELKYKLNTLESEG